MSYWLGRDRGWKGKFIGWNGLKGHKNSTQIRNDVLNVKKIGGGLASTVGYMQGGIHHPLNINLEFVSLIYPYGRFQRVKPPKIRNINART